MTHTFFDNNKAGEDKLSAIFAFNTEPGRVYIQGHNGRLVKSGTCTEDNIKRCIANPPRYIKAINRTTPYCSYYVTSMGVDVDFDDNICDEVTNMMYCTLTADGARPSDKMLSVFSIDKDGEVDYYPSIVSGLQIVYADFVTERYTMQDLQCISKMLRLPFPFLV